MNYSEARTGLISRYIAVRDRTVALTKPLNIEDFVVQPVVDVSPPKWHLGHTTWFFETFVLKPFLTDYKVFDPSFNFLFNSYYESIGQRTIRSERGHITRPTVDEVMKYRAYVDEQMSNFLNSPKAEDAREIIELGLQHEQQHQELFLTDLKYVFGLNPFFPEYKLDHITAERSATTGSRGFMHIDEGIYEIGYNGDGFCFDNELSRHKVYLQSYDIASKLVTNGEYMEFMATGGYETFSYWLAEGWDFAKKLEVNAPKYWHHIDGEWHQYHLGGLEKVNPDAPVTHISYYEADAFAEWKGMRLPTEFEWEVACMHNIDNERLDTQNFANNNLIKPLPESSDKPTFLGNVWEWTASAYAPYPGFKKAEGAIGEYNGKFMINQMVLRGGACSTPNDHIRLTYRNFFHPNLRWQFNGIRLAKKQDA